MYCHPGVLRCRNVVLQRIWVDRPGPIRWVEPIPAVRFGGYLSGGKKVHVLGEAAVNGGSLVVVQGDITTLEVDAVVNAANEQLRHGGGVAAAIAEAGGAVVVDESDEWVRIHGPVGVGQAALTSAGSMPSRYVIHVVGPRYRSDQDNPGLLRSAVVAALETVAGIGAGSVAVPAISAGIFGYPPDEATAVIVSAVADWLREHDAAIRVVLVANDEEMAGRFVRAVSTISVVRPGDFE